MNSDENGRWWTIAGKHGVHVSHLLAEKPDLIFGNPEALRIKYDGTVQLAEGLSLDAAARAFWDAVERIRPPTMAAAAVEKLSAQIGQAIFGEPVTDLIELANRCNRLRTASGGKCITQTMDDAAALLERDMGAPASRRASSDVEKMAQPEFPLVELLDIRNQLHVMATTVVPNFCDLAAGLQGQVQGLIDAHRKLYPEERQ
ncbi:hypothetical protein [Stenotrophomonas sp. 278]|uniref:hypothetical protein n=1 Tax=Stenotrophomonas sp. 278 TaxID=2479851 RepID=UPI000F684EDE|nr:hypothetical protein [Stenotrophomonas sp. 278]RRU13199.1 hypothetical protein EGJ34_11530 [Stenotrophomonas sp. 278]